MRFERKRTVLMVVLTTIVAAACLTPDPAEARGRRQHQWQGWQTSSPNHWNAEAFWAWRAGLLP